MNALRIVWISFYTRYVDLDDFRNVDFPSRFLQSRTIACADNYTRNTVRSRLRCTLYLGPYYMDTRARLTGVHM